MLAEGSEALNQLSSRHAFAKECDRGFTGAEIWLVNLLRKMDKGVTVEGFMKELCGVPDKLRKNPAATGLADVIDGMFEGKPRCSK